MTKRLKLLLIMLVAVVATMPDAVAQEKRRPGKREFPEDNVRREGKIFVEKLSLKGDSAEIFEKTYLEYRRKIHDALESNKGIPGNRRGKKRLTEEQVESNIKKRFACARAILDIREKYYGNFRKVLSPSQYERFNYIEQNIGDKMRDEHHRRARANNASPEKK